MGMRVEHIEDNGVTMADVLRVAPIGTFIWIVGRREPKKGRAVKLLSKFTKSIFGRWLGLNIVVAQWHIQGVTFSEEKAVEMCLDEHYFIGPLPVDVALPHNTVDWAGLYFPLRNK